MAYSETLDRMAANEQPFIDWEAEMAALPGRPPEVSIPDASDWPPIPDLRNGAQNVGLRAGELALQRTEPEPATAEADKPTTISQLYETFHTNEASRFLAGPPKKKPRIASEPALEAAERSYEYTISAAARRHERYTGLATRWSQRADRYQRQGGVWGNVMALVNQSLSRFFGWRARAAQRLKTYYTAGRVLA